MITDTHVTTDYEAVWSRSKQAVDPQALAERFNTLDGKTIAFVWDYMFRGDEIFPVIADELQSQFTDVTIVDYDTFGTTHGEGEARLVATLGERLAAHGVDAVVSGMAC